MRGERPELAESGDYFGCGGYGYFGCGGYGYFGCGYFGCGGYGYFGCGGCGGPTVSEPSHYDGALLLPPPGTTERVGFPVSSPEFP